MSRKGLAGTFALNRVEPIHRWYGYIEGYSSELVENELNAFEEDDIKTIYDPFGGTGTTLLAASRRGIQPYYSETNPFMSKVTTTKINDVITIAQDINLQNQLENFYISIVNMSLSEKDVVENWDGFEKYYSVEAITYFNKIKLLIEKESDRSVKNTLMLALSSVSVECSKMIRRGDLRFAKEREKAHIPSVKESFLEKLKIIIDDIRNEGASIKKRVVKLAEDSRDIEEENIIDCVITSPPYLNGTNYIRNTKLELKLNDYVIEEKELALLHSKGIIAGINNVSKRNAPVKCPPNVKEYIEVLKPVSYDKRIPVMVESYFDNMNSVFERLKKVMKNGSIFIMDIGDSQFAGVHIPTHTILAELCQSHGFHLFEEDILRTRYSKNGMLLSQRIMRFKLEK